MNSVKQRAGQLGGLQTSLRHGPAHMADIGSRGGAAARGRSGRPKLPTLEQIRQQLAPTAPRNNIERGNGSPHALSELKELWKLRVKDLERALPLT